MEIQGYYKHTILPKWKTLKTKNTPLAIEARRAHSLKADLVWIIATSLCNLPRDPDKGHTLFHGCNSKPSTWTKALSVYDALRLAHS